MGGGAVVGSVFSSIVLFPLTPSNLRFASPSPSVVASLRSLGRGGGMRRGDTSLRD